MTRGIAAEGEAFVAKVLMSVRSFDAFTSDNDPRCRRRLRLGGQHDFGSIDIDGHKVFWKLDYYDPEMEFGSEDPADEAKTCRVLTVMLADEY